MNNRGASLIEVVVMMVILSLAIVGIYSTISSGIRFANSIEDRITATNIAREGLERVTALRDTFLLRQYATSGCFFTIDVSNQSSAKCPEVGAKYAFTNTGILTKSTTNTTSPLCLDANGWYTQWTVDASNTTCANAPSCATATSVSCKTKYSRYIDFYGCVGKTSSQCIIARSFVSWWTAVSPQSLYLDLTLTRH